jgi:hypothetical protein
VNVFVICDVHFFLMLQSVLWLKINLSKSEFKSGKRICYLHFFSCYGG